MTHDKFKINYNHKWTSQHHYNRNDFETHCQWDRLSFKVSYEIFVFYLLFLIITITKRVIKWCKQINVRIISATRPDENSYSQRLNPIADNKAVWWLISTICDLWSIAVNVRILFKRSIYNWHEKVWSSTYGINRLLRKSLWKPKDILKKILFRISIDHNCFSSFDTKLPTNWR